MESNLFAARVYPMFLKQDGIMIIEDVQKMEWTKRILSNVPENFTAEVMDLRHVKGKYDDILIVIRPAL